MPNWMDEQIQRQRFADMVSAAERDQLAELVLAMRAGRKPFYSPMLAGFGRRLVLWGNLLLLRYGTMVEPQMAVKTRGHAPRR